MAHSFQRRAATKARSVARGVTRPGGEPARYPQSTPAAAGKEPCTCHVAGRERLQLVDGVVGWALTLDVKRLAYLTNRSMARHVLACKLVRLDAVPRDLHDDPLGLLDAREEAHAVAAWPLDF